MPPTTPNATESFVRMQDAVRQFREQNASLDLTRAGNPTPVLTAFHQTRTYAGQNGITTDKHGSRFLLSCGHQVSSMAEIVGECQSGLHTTPQNSLVCTRCGLHLCSACGRNCCPACLDPSPIPGELLCRRKACTYKRALKGIPVAIGKLVACAFFLLLFEPEHQNGSHTGTV